MPPPFTATFASFGSGSAKSQRVLKRLGLSSLPV